MLNKKNIRKNTALAGPVVAVPQLVNRITSHKVGEIKLWKSFFNDILETLFSVSAQCRCLKLYFRIFSNTEFNQALYHLLLVLYIYSFSVHITTKSWGNFSSNCKYGHYGESNY